MGPARGRHPISTACPAGLPMQSLKRLHPSSTTTLHTHSPLCLAQPFFASGVLQNSQQNPIIILSLPPFHCGVRAPYLLVFTISHLIHEGMSHAYPGDTFAQYPATCIVIGLTCVIHENLPCLQLRPLPHPLLHPLLAALPRLLRGGDHRCSGRVTRSAPSSC